MREEYDINVYTPKVLEILKKSTSRLFVNDIAIQLGWSPAKPGCSRVLRAITILQERGQVRGSKGNGWEPCAKIAATQGAVYEDSAGSLLWEVRAAAEPLNTKTVLVHYKPKDEKGGVKMPRLSKVFYGAVKPKDIESTINRFIGTLAGMLCIKGPEAVVYTDNPAPAVEKKLVFKKLDNNPLGRAKIKKPSRASVMDVLRVKGGDLRSLALRMHTSREGLELTLRELVEDQQVVLKDGEYSVERSDRYDNSHTARTYRQRKHLLDQLLQSGPGTEEQLFARFNENYRGVELGERAFHNLLKKLEEIGQILEDKGVYRSVEG